MKIEESFKDLKSLLQLDKVMNKERENIEKVIALVKAYSIGLLIGEEIRDRMYQVGKWKLYFGLFILLKQRIQLTKEVLMEIIAQVCSLFREIVLGDVRTFV